MDPVDDTEELILDVSVFGASLVMGIRWVGFSVHHQADNSAAALIQDIKTTFTVTRTADDSIDFIYTNEIEKMAYNQGFQFLTNEIAGVGPVELTINVTSSNAEDM